MRHRAGLSGLAVLALALGGTACGGSSGSATPSASAIATAVDPCVVGTWRAVSVAGSLTDSAGSLIHLSGGSGGTLTITGDGSLRIDDTRAQADTGTASDGTVYTITSSGEGSGSVRTSAGQFTVSLDASSAITQTIARNGSPVASQRPASSATDTYTCSRGRSLVITSPGGIVSTFTPAG
ncbi:MAG: hypothetical protein ACYDAC_02390 [Candidatus Dormibacteria bacterium]